MANVNETTFRICRFLDDSYFQKLYEAFIEAFSDYVVPFALTETQFRNHIILNGVDLRRTAGCIDDDKLIGFSLNGFGTWNGISTAYDAGTGVLPRHRRSGVSEAMFEMMLPAFTEDGIGQFLLEVVTSNEGAIRLYEKLGFESIRTLALLQCDAGIASTRPAPAAVELRDIETPDWGLFRQFWDGRPSWQNSVDAVERSRRAKRMVGAWVGDQCVGYIVFSSKFGRVAQLAVERSHRHLGIGTALVRAMQTETADGFSLQVINVEKANTDAVAFFQKLGFYERLCQYEMLMPM